MQTEVPTLPVVCLDGLKRSARKQNNGTRSSSVAVKNHSPCKSAAYLVSNRKQLHPLLGGPYKNTVRIYSLSEPLKTGSKSAIGQRVMSAKMLRVKQLQNQLADAHYHLNELANENRLLKALQKRQDCALRRYEGTNAELPRIINSHHEELRVLQTKYKKLKAQHKETCDLLKEKENELHSLQTQNKHLLQLSKDRNLGEREKLQMQVSDLNHRINLQQDTIQTLNRKLTLETKSLKHQLNLEVARHRETQKHLQESLEKLKTLEDLLDNRERRLYYSGQLPVFHKPKNMGSQSLTNLAERSNAIKTARTKGQNTDNDLLPILAESESMDHVKFGKTIPTSTADLLPLSPKTETMANLHRVRKFRLQKASSNRDVSTTRSKEKSNERRIEENGESAEVLNSGGTRNFADMMAQREANDYERELRRFEENYEKRKGHGIYKLPKELKKEYGYSSSDTDSEETNKAQDPSSKSKELHARLIDNEEESSDIDDNNDKRRTPRFFNNDTNHERFINQEIIFSHESLSKLSKSSIRQIYGNFEHKTEKRYASISESESELEMESGLKEDGEKCKFLLRPVQDDNMVKSEKNNLMEEFFKYDINVAESESEVDKEELGNTQTGLENVKQKSKNFDMGQESVSRDTYDNGHQRLMDITKSWSELQDKIMKEREISERQLKALENNAEDSSLKVKAKDSLFFNDNIHTDKMSLSDLSVLEYNAADKESHFNKVDKAKQFVTQENMNVTVEANTYKSNELLESPIESGEGNAETAPKDDFEKVLESKARNFKNSEADESYLNKIEEELSKIDSVQGKLSSLTAESDRKDCVNYILKSSIEIREKLNDSIKTENLQKLLENAQHVSDATEGKSSKGHKDEMSKEGNSLSYNKEKLLAAMKAIDDNENIEFLDNQKSRRSSISNRSQITENLYRGLPSHAKKKDDLMKEIFGDVKVESKMRNGCSKLH
ncbi:lebercilin [Cephus cinctus]|uniref:Lebercilin n=1 Tax=Cephus cinctus TaxID=211228 RepID=A0AAJ7FSK7_CEPCN|nr:lebercilin [Cephus cinctus]